MTSPLRPTPAHPRAILSRYLPVLLLLCLGWITPTAHAATKPNIIVVLADDIGFECYGCYGSTLYKTPNIDRLARSGALFTHGHSQPMCAPSRVSLLTGRYNIHNYIGWGTMGDQDPTFANLLKAEGYKTYAAGKWQITKQEEFGPRRLGFDDYCLWSVWEGDDGDKAAKSSSPNVDQAMAYFKGNTSRYKNPALIANGAPVQVPADAYGPDIVSNHLLDFIDRNQTTPFAIYYPMLLAHTPIFPTPDFPEYAAGAKPKAPKDLQRFYEAMIAYHDRLIGRLLDKLEQTGLRENTLILFTSDNGTAADQGIYSPLADGRVIVGGKHLTADNGTHVPFIVSWPDKIAPGTVIDTPVHLIDVLPTLTEAVGIKTPTTIDGQSLLPLTQGKTDQARDYLFMSAPNKKGTVFVCYLMDNQWKLYADGGLYHYALDPAEKTIATGPAADAAKAKLEPILKKILTQVPQDRPIKGKSEIK